MTRRTYPEIDALVPHRPPMRLVDAVLEADAQTTRCRARVTAASPFSTADGVVEAVVGLEVIAQCAAAHVGLHAWRSRSASGDDEAPRVAVGLLISCRELVAKVATLPLDVPLEVVVERVAGRPGHGASRFTGELYETTGDGPRRLVQAEFSVYQSNDEANDEAE